ncbi:NAD(P)/FAD-dependent oxidoreductase [Rathayibacter soli]|uniref:NAD(P)/FAD-dependent oxidoreductase n=1 Tax=Rathayibacter soli TaxID=3144168 RepID=UPI0027E3B963|nr:FAD-dependent oxidoreductase [Glaciibacter superstes]
MAGLDHVVIVGAGMVGLSTGYFLQEHGVRVTIVERTAVNAGSSWGNAGWIAPALTIPLPEPAVLAYGISAVMRPSAPLYIPFTLSPKLLRFLVGFARHCTPGFWRSSMAVYAEVAGMAMDAFDELTNGGVAEQTQLAEPFLAGFATEKERAGLLDEFNGIVAAGGAVDYELSDGDELRQLEPALGPGVKFGVKLHGQHFINPPKFVEALAGAVRKRGAEIVTGFDVTHVRDRGRSGVEIVPASGEPVAADAVVIASGTWLGALAHPYGVRELVQAGRGYSFTVVPDAMPTRPIYFPAARVACTPLGDRFRVSGMMEFRSAEAPLDPRRISAVMNAAKPMFTGIDWADRREEWVGSRPCTPDGLPLIGETHSPRVHVAGGHGMWGITLGPLTGKFLAEAMTGGTVPDVYRRFDPLR